MIRNAPLALLLLLSACSERLPCDDVSGTCLNVYLSGDGMGAVDAVQFALEGDGDFRHSARFVPDAPLALPLSQPLILPLPLPESAQRTIRVSAEAERGGQKVAAGARVVADLTPGAHRLIGIRLMTTP